jgi:hypothetical protein
MTLSLAGPLASFASTSKLLAMPGLTGRLLALMLLGSVRYGRTTSAPPPASFPSGRSGRRVSSLIHSSLLTLFTRGMRVSHFSEPLYDC